MQSWKEYFNRHRSVIIGAAIGLLVGILFLTIGFFSTVLLALLGGIGALIGALPKVREAIWNGIIHLIEKIFHKS
ncbi:MAG: DUF2273 domain-containing protein [Clostridiales bacterium]|nr:DUF2273 domain-containing protein [Clostridiales bacterium]